jgi:hypothetical protein
LRSNPSNLVSIILSSVCQILAERVSGNFVWKKWISQCDKKANENDDFANTKNIALNKEKQIPDDHFADNERQVCFTSMIYPFGVIIFAAGHSSKMNLWRYSGHKSTFALRNMMEEALKVWMKHARG